MNNAQQKRENGINAVFHAVVSTEVHDGKPVNIWATLNRGMIAQEIRTLAPLGRTQRWADAVEGWARLVEHTENDVKWAFIQGSILTSHKAS